MYTLGINAAYHDSAACLVLDGEIVAAAEEERFTRIKHGKRPIPFSAYELPFHAIDYCLREAGICLTNVDHVAYAYDPSLLRSMRGQESICLPLEPSAHPVPEDWEAAWDPLFFASVVNAPRHLTSGWPHHLQARFVGAGPYGPYTWHFVPHHTAHAASAFFVSPFHEAAVLTLDGRGERATTTYGFGSGTHLHAFKQVDFPHSLGLVYERVTEYLGFLHSSDEYKVMALASYGRPRFVQEFREMIQVGSDGTYQVADLCPEERFGPGRNRGETLTQHHFDIAHSLQVVLEEGVLQLGGWLQQETGASNLCMAGGVALNCVMNARLLRDGPYQKIWVQPAAGDSGTALGAAVAVDLAERRATTRSFTMQNAFLGPSYTESEIEDFLRTSKLRYRRLRDVPGEVADILCRNQIVGWFQHREEFGPRALGARSILASPIDGTMQSRLNEIKDREDFRPVAPVVLEEEAHHWFEDAMVSPFMLFVFNVRPDKAPLIPAVRHVDGTARIQTINREQHPLYYDLITAFAARTGVPVLVNTSFNTRGEPIVSSPRDAIECFWTSPLDALAIGPFLLEKQA